MVDMICSSLYSMFLIIHYISRICWQVVTPPTQTFSDKQLSPSLSLFISCYTRNRCHFTTYGEMVHWWGFLSCDKKIIPMFSCLNVIELNCYCLLNTSHTVWELNVQNVTVNEVFFNSPTLTAEYKLKHEKAKWRWLFCICCWHEYIHWLHTCGAVYLLCCTGKIFCTCITWFGNVMLCFTVYTLI